MPFISTSEIPVRVLFPGFNARLIHTEQLTIAHVQIEDGSVLPEHHHVHEQIINVLEGTFDLTVGGVTRTVSAGDVAVVHSGVPHSLVARTAGKILDVFHPARDDYR